jgi:hypothetical protein
MMRRIDNVKTDDEAIEAIGALRELLALGDLPVSKPVPFVLARST